MNIYFIYPKFCVEGFSEYFVDIVDAEDLDAFLLVERSSSARLYPV